MTNNVTNTVSSNVTNLVINPVSEGEPSVTNPIFNPAEPSSPNSDHIVTVDKLEQGFTQSQADYTLRACAYIAPELFNGTLYKKHRLTFVECIVLPINKIIIDDKYLAQTFRSGANPKTGDIKEDIKNVGWKLNEIPIIVLLIKGKYYMADGRTRFDITTTYGIANVIVLVYVSDGPVSETFGNYANSLGSSKGMTDIGGVLTNLTSLRDKEHLPFYTEYLTATNKLAEQECIPFRATLLRELDAYVFDQMGYKMKAADKTQALNILYENDDSYQPVVAYADIGKAYAYLRDEIGSVDGCALIFDNKVNPLPYTIEDGIRHFYKIVTSDENGALKAVVRSWNTNKFGLSGTDKLRLVMYTSGNGLCNKNPTSDWLKKYENVTRNWFELLEVTTGLFTDGKRKDDRITLFGFMPNCYSLSQRFPINEVAKI